MDFAALFPPLAPSDEASAAEFSSVDMDVSDIELKPLEKAVDDGIYRALRRWNEGDSALTDKALPYVERVRKYQRIAALALQPDAELDTAEERGEEQDDAATESEEEQPQAAGRAEVVAKQREALAAAKRQRKERRKVQREHEEERKRFRFVFEELDDIDELRAERVPSERLQKFVNSFKTKKRRLVQKRSVADTTTAMSFEFARPTPEVHAEEKKKEEGGQTDNDPILWFDVLHPSKDPARTQSFVVRRSQPISELIDLIACANDERLHEHDKNSKLLYFGQKFFVDRRAPGSLDYSEQIIRWIQAAPERQAKYGTFTGEREAPSIHMSTFADLELHIDVPGVYIHQGECEHLVRLRDARLPHELDSAKIDGVFPLRLPNPLNRTLRNCLICQHYSAKYVCYGDRLAMMDPMFFCKRCYRAAHYDAKGNLLYNDFLSFPFVQD